MWHNRNVWIILIGELIVGLGLWAGIIGNLGFMQQLIPSDFHKSVLLAIGMLAGFLVGPIAGKMVDRYAKKSVLIWSSVGRIISVFFMFVAIYFESIVWMMLFLIVLQIAAAFFMPAMQAIVPIVVKDDELMTMNGWHMNVRTISRIIGTAAAGLLIVTVDLIWLYIISLIMYVLMLGCMFMLKIDEEQQQAKAKHSGSFKEVLPIFKEQPIVLMAFCLAVIPTLFLGSFNLVIINIVELQQNQSISGILYTVEGIGFMLGAFFVRKLTTYMTPTQLLFTVALVISVLDLSLGFSHISWMPIVTFAVFGFAVGCFFPSMMTIFQRQVPKSHHGRFFAFRNMFDTVLFQIVLLSTGALLDLIGLQQMGIVFGVISLTLTCFFFLYVKKSAMQVQ
ncbi:macrolide transporter [Caryophanon tenue]|uniref:Macrolide transporter n=2 Tax=Caryophanon tenue TaxID=33978 RepID=A0A1C0YHX6_9BACL|nr:macrolide transporter [Caryophanon tenue]